MVTSVSSESPAASSWRTPGCDARCRVVRALLPGVFGPSELVMCSAETHEEYGWTQAGRAPHDLPSPFDSQARSGQAPAGLVSTGPLTVDLRRLVVELRGVPLALPRRELKLLAALTRRAGTLVPRADLVVEALGWPPSAVGGQDGWQALRQSVTKVRSALGDAEGLIVTVPGLGYRLELVPAGAPAPARAVHPWALRRLGRWARDWDRCRGCRTTRYEHRAHGYCGACRWSVGRRSAPPVLSSQLSVLSPERSGLRTEDCELTTDNSGELTTDDCELTTRSRSER